jgi:putative sigma-54 modulation protein
MKLEYTFLHVDSSEALMEYFRARFTKLEKFELKPMDVQVLFSMERHECIVDVLVLEGRRKFKAHSVSADFYRSVDMVVNKLVRQMSKDKRRLKEHKNPQASSAGKMARLTPELELDFSREPIRKVS